ncbi:hypothetical protein KAU33_08810 [Candidatus Dependentiae bacterium]|nr:hypothetical protein [Candidatus Dependentiae bacterium]
MNEEQPDCLQCGRCCSELGQNRMMISDCDIARWIQEERWDILKSVTQCAEGSWLDENSCYSIIKEKGFVQCHTCHGGVIINPEGFPGGKCLFLKKKGNICECSIQETKPDHCERWRVGKYEKCPQNQSN